MTMSPTNRIIAHSESVGTGAAPDPVGIGNGVGTGTGGAGPPLHDVTALLSSVTAPLRASVLPLRLAPVVIVMLVSARMFPAIELAVPMVAELVTCHHTPQAEAPFRRTTDEAEAVVSELAIWKMYTPAPSSVSVPVNAPAPMQ